MGLENSRRIASAAIEKPDGGLNRWYPGSGPTYVKTFECIFFKLTTHVNPETQICQKADGGLNRQSPGSGPTYVKTLEMDFVKLTTHVNPVTQISQNIVSLVSKYQH